jgi:arylamine N-acetyltransferase
MDHTGKTNGVRVTLACDQFLWKIGQGAVPLHPCRLSPTGAHTCELHGTFFAKACDEIYVFETTHTTFSPVHSQEQNRSRDAHRDRYNKVYIGTCIELDTVCPLTARRSRSATIVWFRPIGIQSRR